ncbi:MAG: DUF2179 domain-containing protein [Anaerolineales bacterium]
MDDLGLIVLIFGLRVINNAIGSVRIIVMTNGQRRLAFGLAFIESAIFAFTAGQVLTDLDHIGKLFAYALGFAVGGYVGMSVEERLIAGYVVVTITTPVQGADIAAALRAAGYGVTETGGYGADGNVAMLRCVAERQHAADVIRRVHEINERAFITTEEARAVHRGWMRARRLQRR